MFEQRIDFPVGRFQGSITIYVDAFLEEETVHQHCMSVLESVRKTLLGIDDPEFSQRLLQESCVQILRVLQINAIKIQLGGVKWARACYVSQDDLKGTNLPVEFIATPEGLVELQEVLSEPIPEPVDLIPNPAPKEDLWEAEPERPQDPQAGDFMMITTGEFQNAVLVVEEYQQEAGLIQGKAIATYGALPENQAVEIPLSILRKVTEDEALASVQNFGMWEEDRIPVFLDAPDGIVVEDYTDGRGHTLLDEQRIMRQAQIYNARTKEEHTLERNVEAHLMFQAALGGGIDTGDA